ncbi:hypothetical protein [Herbaspirillum frisingense]|uniref:hypothetical protein n=1 Tax=Herbaspirillum frisingense TaxID=92645 RepID=UPI00398C2AFC|nr:hypothetical protein LAZ82_20400 [Herbaspirillum frisingense]
MSRVRSKSTGPQMQVRKLVYSTSCRYRIHNPRLPGKPSLVFVGKKKAIFLHWCFWHRHANCKKRASTPSTNNDYWIPKCARQ